MLISWHGGSAAYYAAWRPDDMFDCGQLEGAAVWREIAKAIESLLALDPTGGIN